MIYNGIVYDIKWYSKTDFNNFGNDIPYSNPDKNTIFVNQDDLTQIFQRGNNNIKEDITDILKKELENKNDPSQRTYYPQRKNGFFFRFFPTFRK